MKSSVLEKKVNLEKVLSVAAFLCCGCLLILMSGLKPIGFDPDSINYVAVLKYHPSEYNLLIFEPLHWVLVYLNNILFDSNPHTFFALYALIFVSLFLYAIFKTSISPLLSLLVFLFVFFPNYGLIQIRQGIALALLLNSIEDISQNRLKPFLIKAILATGFHYSSPILFLSLFFSEKMRLPITTIVLIPISCFILGECFISLNMFYYLSDFVGGGFGYKLKNYLLLMEIEGQASSVNRINPLNTYVVFIWSLGILFGYLYKKMDINKRILFNMLLFGLSFWFLFVQFPVLSFRLFYPLSGVATFILPYVLNKIKPRSIAVALFVLMLFAIFYNIYIRHALFNFDLIL